MTQMRVSEHGLRLIQQFEGAPRLKARLCEGGAWELSYGVTFDLDGSAFDEQSTCTPEYALKLFQNALGRFERALAEMVHVPLTAFQFDALVALCYNIGEANFARSSVLREVNNERFEDAAAAFGMWIYATKDGHKQALRGLLRRRYAEACLFLGYDWVEACADDAIALKREVPEGKVGTDRVLFKTPFHEVLRVAQRYPLLELAPAPKPDASVTIITDATKELVLDQPVTAEPATGAGKGGGAPVAPQPMPEAPPAPKATEKPAASPAGPAGGGVVPHSLPPPVPKVPDPPVPIGQQREAVEAGTRPQDWSSDTKAMWQSRRFYGLVLIMAGRIWMLKTGSNAFLGAVSDPLVMEFVGGFCVMIAGEIVQAWGRRKATKALH